MDLRFFFESFIDFDKVHSKREFFKGQKNMTRWDWIGFAVGLGDLIELKIATGKGEV